MLGFITLQSSHHSSHKLEINKSVPCSTWPRHVSWACLSACLFLSRARLASLMFTERECLLRNLFYLPGQIPSPLNLWLIFNKNTGKARGRNRRKKGNHHSSLHPGTESDLSFGQNGSEHVGWGSPVAARGLSYLCPVCFMCMVVCSQCPFLHLYGAMVLVASAPQLE